MVSEASGGPLKYKGPSMKEVHKGMGISDAEMDAMLADLKKALDMNGVKGEDAEAVLKAVDATRKDIVEKKPEEKKPEDKKPAGEESVEGKVTYKGKPLPSGTITLVGEKGTAVTGAIAEDGSYKLAGLQPGTYKVAVATPKVGEKEPPVKIPEKYSDPEKSGLTYEVKKGKQTFDISLE
jgi:Carboxypeptidase regulatory-like domain/Bacterial-like globin